MTKKARGVVIPSILKCFIQLENSKKLLGVAVDIICTKDLQLKVKLEKQKVANLCSVILLICEVI